jgi:hypothetical protein
LTADGIAGVGRLGLTVGGGNAPGRRQLYGCVDWSERRDHFAGPLAVAMLNAFVERGWLRRRNESRVLDVTPAGRAELLQSLLA